MLLSLVISWIFFEPVENPGDADISYQCSGRARSTYLHAEGAVQSAPL
jgi:hypothetical protein